MILLVVQDVVHRKTAFQRVGDHAFTYIFYSILAFSDAANTTITITKAYKILHNIIPLPSFVLFCTAWKITDSSSFLSAIEAPIIIQKKVALSLELYCLAPHRITSWSTCQVLKLVRCGMVLPFIYQLKELFEEYCWLNYQNHQCSHLSQAVSAFYTWFGIPQSFCSLGSMVFFCPVKYIVNQYLSHHITSDSIHWWSFKTTLNFDALYSETKEKNSVKIRIKYGQIQVVMAEKLKRAFYEHHNIIQCY